MIFNNEFYLKDTFFKLTWSQIEITGPDGIDFLNKQSTNDIKNLNSNQFKLNSLLSPDGKVESFFIMCLKGEKLNLLLPIDHLQKTVDRIEKYHVVEDFNLISTKAVDFYLHMGPSILKKSFNGEFFGAACSLVFDPIDSEANQGEINDHNLFFSLIGYDDNIIGKLFTSTLLSSYAFHSNKGCFPGQEPTSKILNNRGAAYFPTLIQSSDPINQDQLFYQGKLIAKNLSSFEYNNKYYFKADLLRDLRVNNKEIILDADNQIQGIIHYFPHQLLNEQHLAQYYFQKAAKLSLKKECSSEAKDLLHKTLSIDPSHQDAIEIMGVLNANQDNYLSAIEWMKKLEQINPNSIMAQTNLSLYYMKIGDIETAEKHKAEATYLSFKSMAPKKNEVHELQNKKINMFNKVIEIDETDTMANLGLGQIYFEQEKFELAKLHLEKVLKIDPQYSQAYLYLGKTLLSLNNEGEAKKILITGIPVATKKGELMPANEMEILLKNLS